LAESQQTPLKHVGKWERVQGKFEDAKGVIRSSKSKKDRQYNGKKKRPALTNKKPKRNSDIWQLPNGYTNSSQS
jgi:hypothetical protein